MSVTIYVEGGGDHNDATLTACRKAFKIFLKRMLPGKDMPVVQACGSRESAFKDFKTALGVLAEGDCALLLVDSEDPIENNASAWAHLANRDTWVRSIGADDDHAHLMVQCMESWFLADPEALSEYFNKGFKSKSLPKPVNGNIEGISKAQVAAGLKKATRETASKEYHKTRDGFKLLERIDPLKVIAVSKQAKRLHTILTDLLATTASVAKSRSSG